MPGPQEGGKGLTCPPGSGREVARCAVPTGRKVLRQVQQDWSSSCWYPEGHRGAGREETSDHSRPQEVLCSPCKATLTLSSLKIFCTHRYRKCCLPFQWRVVGDNTESTVLCSREGRSHGGALQDHVSDLSGKVKCVRKPIWENSHMHMKNHGLESGRD